jgi:hypothetical protein
MDDFSIVLFFFGVGVSVDGVCRSFCAVDGDGSLYVVHTVVAIIEIDGCHCSGETVVLVLRHFHNSSPGGRANRLLCRLAAWHEEKDL